MRKNRDGNGDGDGVGGAVRVGTWYVGCSGIAPGPRALGQGRTVGLGHRTGGRVFLLCPPQPASLDERSAERPGVVSLAKNDEGSRPVWGTREPLFSKAKPLSAQVLETTHLRLTDSARQALGNRAGGRY